MSTSTTIVMIIVTVIFHPDRFPDFLPNWHLYFLPCWHFYGFSLPNELLFGGPFLFFYHLPDSDLLTLPYLLLLLNPNLFFHGLPHLNPFFLPFQFLLGPPNCRKRKFYVSFNERKMRYFCFHSLCFFSVLQTFFQYGFQIIFFLHKSCDVYSQPS